MDETTLSVSGNAPVVNELPAPTRVDRFVILRELGSGAMGTVYVAYDEELNRKVALKVMRTMGQGKADVHSRMLREAQGLARLSHPNVVQVYEARRDELGRVFLVMEFIEGHTLRRWARERERGWRELLKPCIDAGRGLAAAHRAGLVHRDFKPDNVLVDAAGRGHVLDFGLVRAAGEGAEADRVLRAAADLGVSVSGSHTSLELELTAANTLIGTPAYMSPEQHLREAAGPPADQFSFCAVVYELLYGVRPFLGRSQKEIMAAVLLHRFSTPPDGRRVPSRIRRVLVRGLSITPSERWPSMEELLDALSRDPAQRRRRWIGLLSFGAAVAVGAALLAREFDRREAVCEHGEEALAGAWSAERRARVAEALRATGLVYVDAVADNVGEHLDGYRRAWIDMHEEACRSHQQGRQSGELLDLRMACLERHRQRLDALAGTLEQTDAALAERAVQATRALPGLDACADAEALQSRVRPPDDPAIAARVRELRGAAATVEALLSAARLQEGLRQLDELSAEVTDTGYEPLLAEFALLRGQLLRETADYEGSARALEDAFFTARGCGHARVAVAAATELVRVTAHGLGDVDRGERWSRHAAAEVKFSGTPAQSAEYLSQRGMFVMRRGRFDEAREDLARALELRERMLDADHPLIAESLCNIGAVNFSDLQYDAARSYFTRCYGIQQRVFGDEHPVLAETLNRLAAAHGRLEQPDEALAAARRALAIQEKALGPDHPLLANILYNTAILSYRIKRLDDAEELARRALETGERTYGAEHHNIATFLSFLGGLMNERGRRDEALAHLKRALAIGEQGLGAEHPVTSAVLENLAELLNDAEDFAEARAHAERALAIREKAHGTDTLGSAAARHELARALRGLGKPKDALPHARFALERRVAATGETPRSVARSRFLLARLLTETGGDPAEAESLARAAERQLAEFEGARAELEAVRAWLDTRAAGR